MAKLDTSTKRIAISKTNAQMVAVVAAASFITVFCLVASRAVWSQNGYQSRVTAKQETAKANLDKSVQAFGSLVNSYNSFNSASTNVIAGNSSGTAGNDGKNAKIILDALPSAYDFPALNSSIEKMLDGLGLKLSSITGTDDQVNQQKNSSSPSPQPVSMAFSFTVSSANYSSVSQLITTLQQSIRPIQIDSLELSGGVNDMTATINAHTYYQPAKDLGITKQAVK